MGVVIDGKCACGYVTRACVGPGMSTIGQYEPFPFLCEDCAALVEVNKLDAVPRCEKCGGEHVRPLSDPELSEPPPWKGTVATTAGGPSFFASVEEFADFFEVSNPEEAMRLFDEVQTANVRILATPCWGIHTGRYRCPKCHEFALTFEAGIRFD